MPPPVDLHSLAADDDAKRNDPAFFGKHCALLLAVGLLALLSLTTLSRWWLPDGAFPVEKIIQQPVAPETSTFSTQNPEAIAPDPGDAPP